MRLSSIDEFDPRHSVSVDSGKGDCPPEDVGGVYGYADFLARAFRREAIDAQQYQSVKYVLKMRDLCNF